MSSVSMSNADATMMNSIDEHRASSDREDPNAQNRSIMTLNAIDNRNCRDINSEYKLKTERPPCHHHPTGILSYQYHYAYDELFKEKPSRRIAYIVLLGHKNPPLYDYLCKHIDKYLNQHRNEFLGLDLSSQEAQAPYANLRQLVMNWMSEKRSDQDWRLREDETYIDLALNVVATESHRTWDTRPQQSGGRNMRTKNPGRRVELSRGDSPSEPSIFQSRVKLSRPTLGSTLTTAIDVDDDDVVYEGVSDSPNLRSAPASVRASVSVSAPLQALANRNYLKAPADLDINNLAEVQKAFFRLQHENKQKEKVIARLNETNLQQRQAGSRAEADRDQLKSDNAALGVALAETLKIRKGSQTAVVSGMARQARLPQDVTERLMQNRSFTSSWFPGATIVHRQ